MTQTRPRATQGNLTTHNLSEFERASGVALNHIMGLNRLCAERNVFLFLRPTEFASTLLIKEGFATKSMDIHHKSSNWGPMAGMVPVDPAFNKKCGATPDKPTPKDPVEDPRGDESNHPHGASDTVQLVLSDSLLQLLEGKGEAPEPTLRLLTKGPEDKTRKYEATAQAKDVPNASKVYFYLTRKEGGWEVTWSKRTSEQQFPLYVFAYQTGEGLKPVTGDYDMWMVAPHMAWWKLHSHVLKVEDDHGGSAATLFNSWFVEQMNVACGREDNPVFNHGAEQQNYGFTQALDTRLAMFTPGGTSRMVDMADMPQIMAELVEARYLVIYNRRYEEIDPHLMATPLKEEQRRVFEVWREKRKNPLFQNMQELKEARELAVNTSKEAARIHEFYDALSGALQALPDLRKLAPVDFGKHYRPSEAAIQRLQRQLQEKLVSATIGGGQSDLNNLDDWFISNIELLESLSEAFGPAPGPPLPELSFMLSRSKDSKDSFVRRAPKPSKLPPGTEWSSSLGLVVCARCKKSAKLVNPSCRSHTAVSKKGKLHCSAFFSHSIDEPGKSCSAALCALQREEKRAEPLRQEAIKKARH